MLIDQDLVSVRIEKRDARWSRRRLIRFGRQNQALFLERPLNFSHVVEVRQGGGTAVPARIVRQNVLVKHSLKQINRGSFVLHDQVAFGVSAEDSKAELLVERTGRWSR